MHLELTDDETAALLNLLTQRSLTAVTAHPQAAGSVAKFGPMGPALPAARLPKQDASRGRAGRDDLVILAQAKEIPGQSRGICVTF
jgi:hypothetical protein